MTSDLPSDQEECLMLTKTEVEKVVAALQASVEDFAAGRWISTENYEAQTETWRQAHSAAKDDK